MRTPKPPEEQAIAQEIGRRIRLERQRSGLTQTELGGAVGASYQRIHKFERGDDALRAAMLVRLAKALGCRPVRLLPRV